MLKNIQINYSSRTDIQFYKALREQSQEVVSGELGAQIIDPLLAIGYMKCIVVDIKLLRRGPNLRLLLAYLIKIEVEYFVFLRDGHQATNFTFSRWSRTQIMSSISLSFKNCTRSKKLYAMLGCSEQKKFFVCFCLLYAIQNILQLFFYTARKNEFYY